MNYLVEISSGFSVSYKLNTGSSIQLNGESVYWDLVTIRIYLPINSKDIKG